MNTSIDKLFLLRRYRQQVALAALIMALLPGAAAAEAARVTFAHGGAAAIGTDGARRVLNRGSEIDAGDTVSTGRGRAQLRFTDGSFVSLKPGTEFRVDEYAFKDRAEPEQRGFFSLLRGGLRTITGLIGRARKANYRMRTSVATIGIRGTEYNLDLLSTAGGEPLLKWNVADDGTSAIVVFLASGEERVVPWGSDGSATREQFEQLVAALQQLADTGQLQGVSAEAVEEVFAAGEVDDGTGRAALLARLIPAAAQASTQTLPLAPPPDCAGAPNGCALAAAFGAFDASAEPFARADALSDAGAGTLAVFDGVTGGLLSYQANGMSPLQSGQDGDGGNVPARVVVDGSAYFSVDPANPRDAKTIATWGRWIAPSDATATTGGEFPHPLQLRQGSQDTFAYAVSIPTAETFNTGEAVYTIAGFTPPAVFTPDAPGAGAAALGAPGMVNGTLTANFDNPSVALDMNVPFANGSYNLSSPGLGLGININNTITVGAQVQPFFNGGVAVNGSGVACAGGGCSGAVAGNLFGPQADGAALGYAVQDPNLAGAMGPSGPFIGTDITGAAVFKRQSCAGCDVVPVNVEIITIEQ